MKRLLVIRLSAMGDVAMTSPIVQAVRREAPELEIFVLTRPFFRPFYRDIDGVKFVELDLKGRHHGLAGIVRLWRDIMRDIKPDAVADLHDVLRSKLLRTLLRFSGVKVAVLDKGRREKRTLLKLGWKKCNPLKSTHSRYADVFRKLGLQIKSGIEITRHTRKIPSVFGAKEGLWLGIAPFAQHFGKMYPMKNMTKVIESLSGYDNLKIFIFGGGATEKAVAEKLEQEYPNVVSAIGKVSLSEECDLTANLDLLVSMDSSAMHMASLEGVRVISIWGATHPHAGFLGYGQSLDDAVQLPMECRPCSIYGKAPCRRNDYACMNDISPEIVAEKIKSILNLK